MTEKRFTYEYDEYNGNLFDNKMNTFYHIEDSDENIKIFCDRLNSLVEENEQLKQTNERICDDIDLALGFIRHKGYSLQDIKDYEDAKKEYEEDLKAYRKGDVE